MKNKYLPILIILAGFLISAYFYPNLPNTLVSHWGLYGEPNGYSSKSVALFIMPVVACVMYFLFLFLPKLDPLHKNIKLFEGHYTMFINFILAFLLYLHILTIVWNLGYVFNFIVFLVPAFSALSYFLGILLENAKRNWFIGIRTPWTLSNDEIWNKTHKLGSKLYKYLAIFPICGTIFQQWAFILTVIPLVGASLFLVFYSYYLYRKAT